MPDWQELVRQRLSDLALDAEEKDEVQVELAAHLEESYEVFCKEGLPEREALHRTLEQVADWRDLQRRICIAKRRSEERRVGKEWRFRGSPFPLKKKEGLCVGFPKIRLNQPIVCSKYSDILCYVPRCPDITGF